MNESEKMSATIQEYYQKDLYCGEIYLTLGLEILHH